MNSNAEILVTLEGYVDENERLQKRITELEDMIVRLHNTHANDIVGMLKWWTDMFALIPRSAFSKSEGGGDVIGGYCGKCGAPFYVPFMWHGIDAPSARPSCNCWNIPQSVITNTTSPPKTDSEGGGEVSDE